MEHGPDIHVPLDGGVGIDLWALAALEALCRRQANTACSSTHRVRLPREINALLYSDQLRTRYLKMKSDLRIDSIYTSCRWSRPIHATRSHFI